MVVAVAGRFVFGSVEAALVRGDVDPYTQPASYVALNWISILAYLLLLVAAWFLFEIVRRTTENQEEKFETVTQETVLVPAQ